jgi:hypothetical protein
MLREPLQPSITRSCRCLASCYLKSRTHRCPVDDFVQDGQIGIEVCERGAAIRMTRQYLHNRICDDTPTPRYRRDLTVRSQAGG